MFWVNRNINKFDKTLFRKYSVNPVDLVIFACLDLRKFVVSGLYTKLLLELLL